MNLAIGTIDVVIIVVYLVLTMAVGSWIGRRASTTNEYFLGSRELPWWALLISIVASETSTVTFLSVPGLAFAEQGNLGFLQLAGGFVLGRLVVAGLFLPSYFSGSLMTSYELLEQRLGSGTRRLSSALFLISRTIGDALRLFLTALVLYKVIGLNLPLCVIGVGVATIVYTFVGGLRSVVWNDCIQFVIYIGGAIWALVVLLQMIPGGWSEVWSFAELTQRDTIIVRNPLTPGINFWTGIVGGTFLSIATHGTDHLVVQRLLGARSLSDARRAVILSGVVVFFQFAFFLVIGLALACFYQLNPAGQSFSSNDEVFVTFIVDNLGVGVVGLILAAVFAAAMSTQSSSLNSQASAAINDFYRPWFGQSKNEQHLVVASKIATVVFGVLQIGVAIAAFRFVSDRSTVMNVLSIASFAYGPVLGLFFLAVIRRQSTPFTSFAAFAVGLLTLVVLKLLSLGDEPVLAINGLWFAAIGSLVTLAAGIGLHRFTQPKRGLG